MPTHCPLGTRMVRGAHLPPCFRLLDAMSKAGGEKRSDPTMCMSGRHGGAEVLQTQDRTGFLERCF